MAEIKTGNKGFVNPVDGKVYTYDSVTPGSPGANEQPANYDPGTLSVDNTVKDLSKKTKITLGTYLSKLTKGEVAPSTTANAFPIDEPTDSSLESSITTNGYPTPLGISGNSTQFRQILPSSFSEDYPAVQSAFKKGRGVAEIPDGNQLLSDATVGDQSRQLADGPVKDYTERSTDPNRWRPGDPGFSGGEDITQPSAEFDVSLQSAAVMGLPSEEVLAGAAYKLDLKQKVAVVKQETASNAYPATPGTPNDDPNINSITSPDGSYPSPLTPPANQNLYVHAPNLPPGTSEAFIPISNDIKKGKSPSTAADGNTLLGKSIVTGENGVTSLPDPIETYVNEELSGRNDYAPDSPLLSAEIDVTAPPATYDDAYSLKYVTTPGKHSGRSKYEKQIHEELSLDELRLIPSAKTINNSYSIVAVDPQPPLQPLSVDGVPTPLVDSSNPERYVENKIEIKPTSSPDTPLNNFSKGVYGVSAQGYNGNNLLRTVAGNVNVTDDKYQKFEQIELTNPLSPGVSRGTVKTSNDSSDHPVHTYRRNGGGDAGAAAPYIINNRFVGREPADGFNPVMLYLNGDPKKPVTALTMAKIGTALSQRASAEIPGWPGGTEYDPTGAGADAGAILPSVAQLGILKVDNTILSAKDVLDVIAAEDPIPPEGLAEIAPFGGQSWGTMTNVSEPFDDAFASIGLFLTLLALVLAISLLFGLIAFIVPSGERSLTLNSKGERTLGKYVFEEPSSSFFSFFPSVFEIFGIKPTINPYEEALVAGTFSFFLGAAKLETSFLAGLAALAQFAVTGLDAILGENSSIGANLVVCRTIIRSGLIMAEYISRIIQRSALSAVAGVAMALNILRVFRSSKLIAAINVFSSLGDQLLNSKLNGSETNGPDGKPMSHGSIDSVDPTDPQAAVKKSRLTQITKTTGLFGDTVTNEFNSTLAWSSQRSRALYLVPPSIEAMHLAGIGLGSNLGPAVLNKENARSAYVSANSRIPDATRSFIEQQLDAEYVPFYFHDVRTNEIISFHAFLTSMSDDYNASYDSVESFGRVEPIKIYKGTTRRIGLSFHVASTSKVDFDHMWYKLNKLSTLVYPQYTQGKLQGTADGASFRAPFSQLQGASPLIRIRLGDLLRSNYSRFALARLFGAADGNMATANDKIIDIKKPTGDQLKNLATALSSLEKETEVEVLDGKPRSNPITVAGQVPEAGKATQYTISFGGIERTVPAHLVRPTDDALQNIIKKSLGTNDGPLANLSDFMDPNKNAVVKSFESAGGKGLAGFIDSMAFDWYDKTTWETDLGSAAPKMCKVTISFSPIHDISPGIDHLGYNRAPIYPVGEAMKSTLR